MSISGRIQGTLEDWSQRWNDRLRRWMADWLSWGIELFFDVLAKSAAPKFKPLIDKIESETEIPPELKPLLDELKAPTGEIGAVLAQSAGSALVGGAIGKIIDYILRPLVFGLSFTPGFFLHDPGTLLLLWRRGFITEEYLNDHLHFHGLGTDDIKQLKDVTLFVPSASDIVSWYAKEVYEPDMITRYGLDSELPNYPETDFPKIGVDPKQATNFWRAHWVHASWGQVVEMLHRGLITEEDVYEWFRLVEIPPYWRDLLIKTAYTWPTRVDVRRWWDMRTIDEARLRELYEGMGYRGKNLDDYILWTKVYVAFPDLVARWKNGWITEEQVRSELVALGMPPERVETMIQTKIKPVGPERVEGEKSLTKAEIYAGVKKGVISWDNGLELLQDLGYGAEEAQFILEVRVGVLEGSPETYSEFKEWTQRYKLAMGLPAKIPPIELQEAEKALKDAEAELKRAKEEGVKEVNLAPYEKAVSDAAYRYRQLLLKWQAEQKAQ